MKSKKSILNLILVVLLIFSSVSIVFSSNIDISTVEIKGRATQTLVIPINENMKPTDEEKELLIKGGWKYNNKGFYRVYPNRLGTIEYNNEEVIIDDKGYFNIEIQGEFNEDLLEVNGYDKNQFRIDTKNMELSNNLIMLDTQVDFYDFAIRHITPEEIAELSIREDGSFDIGINSDPGDPRYGGFTGESLISHSGHNDATYSKNSYITCNRFNGHLGDQVYYNKAAHVYASGVNFTLSDCDVSIFDYGAPCLNTNGGDYDADPTKRYCTSWTVAVNRTATCSERTGHRPLYHKHTSSFEPSGY